MGRGPSPGHDPSSTCSLSHGVRERRDWSTVDEQELVVRRDQDARQGFCRGVRHAPEAREYPTRLATPSSVYIHVYARFVTRIPVQFESAQAPVSPRVPVYPVPPRSCPTPTFLAYSRIRRRTEDIETQVGRRDVSRLGQVFITPDSRSSERRRIPRVENCSRGRGSMGRARSERTGEEERGENDERARRGFVPAPEKELFQVFVVWDFRVGEWRGQTCSYRLVPRLHPRHHSRRYWPIYQHCMFYSGSFL